MRRCVPFLSFCILMLLITTSAYAVVIVDTGQPPGDEEPVVGWTLASHQWLAAEFSLASSHTLTSVEGWLREDTGGTVTAVIYGDGGLVPDTSSELFSQVFSVPSPDPSEVSFSSWHGVTGVSWALTPGDYWAAFEVRSDNTYSGAMPFDAPFPTVHEASRTDPDPNYVNVDNLDFGLRIHGDPSVIPEPSSLILLLTSALVGLASSTRYNQI